MSDERNTGDGQHANPTRVVADADVLAADLLVGGPAREALGHVRRHSWVELLASDALLDDATAVIATLADENLAGDWRALVERERVAVSHPPGDHPGLASAYRGDAAHLLTFDPDLASAGANLSVQPYAALSIRTPDAFARLFDPASLYESRHDGPYPGPDRNLDGGTGPDARSGEN
jgi:predicted nucleic acid-binding protein